MVEDLIKGCNLEKKPFYVFEGRERSFFGIERDNQATTPAIGKRERDKEWAKVAPQIKCE